MLLNAHTRVPAATDGDGGGFLWQHRNHWVLANHDDWSAARKHRKKLVGDFEAKHRRRPTATERNTLENQLDAFMESHHARYAEFIEGYRQRLLAIAALDDLTLRIQRRRDGLRVEVDVRLRGR